ncbi:ethanolamine kinase 1 [Anomaloglossus baeobatrachus]|uniref:ethanolamine kinase 1 n=1 Tax=Anomaloglossus baeobatrachus TaxID=238106 RepID=UPI003F4FCFB2
MANYIHVPPGSPEVPRLELTVLEAAYREGALRLLRELRPEWRPEEVTTQAAYLGSCDLQPDHCGGLVVSMFGGRTPPHTNDPSPPLDDVQFIDYEYSGYNYQAYDIGNHFNEFAGVNEVDYSLYPERALQLQWLQAYLEAYKEFKGVKAEVSGSEVQRLYVQVNQFALASHFFWGLWALIQAKYSKIDFDFLGYAVVRLNQYFKMKPGVMGLTLPE